MDFVPVARSVDCRYAEEGAWHAFVAILLIHPTGWSILSLDGDQHRNFRIRAVGITVPLFGQAVEVHWVGSDPTVTACALLYSVADQYAQASVSLLPVSYYHGVGI